MNSAELAVQAQRAIDSSGMECVGDLGIVDLEKIHSGKEFPLHFRGTTSTPDLAAYGFVDGKWEKIPNQKLNVVAHAFHVTIPKPGFYALLRPKRSDPPPAYTPLHPSPAEALKAAEVDKALASAARTLSDFLAPHPMKLTPDQMEQLESLFRELPFTPFALLTRYGVAVWHRDSRFIGKRLDEGPDGREFCTHAFELAYVGKKTVACAMPSGRFEVGFPVLTDWIVGVLVVHC